MEETIMVHKKKSTQNECFRFLVAFIVVSAVILAGNFAFASEGGGNHYPGGNEDFMAGAAPPPGFYFLNYLSSYNADKLRDNNGNKIPVDFKLDAVANVFRFVYVSKMNVLGGNLLFHTIVPVANVHVSVAGNGESKTGLGDIVVGPALAWHMKNLHLVAALDIVTPTGSYDEKDLANIGRNYWSFNPIFAVTYLSDGGWETSGKLQYFINTKNKSNDYRSGDEFSMDYLLGKHIGNLNIGINGHYLLQTTDDSMKSEPANFDGNRGSVLSVGPAIQYNYKNMFFTAKYQFDTNVKNRPEGQTFWFKFMFAF
jgi:hypothetical protein